MEAERVIMTTVTFDSNVWEIVVDPLKRSQDQECTAIHAAIQRKIIRPYFFEGILALESVKKTDRKEYFTTYRATITTQIDDEEPIVRKGTPAPELPEYLKRVVPLAIDLGFRFIRLPRVGMPVGPPEWAAPDDFYSLEERLARSFEFVRYVDSLRTGGDDLSVGRGGSTLNERKYSSAVAERADIDALAAHYGYGIEIFCTRDKGRSAGKDSVLAPGVLATVGNKYGVTVMTPTELCSTLKI